MLLATVTYLPELIASVSAVTLNDLPSITVSGTIGSCMFNMMVIALLDVLSKHRPVSHMVHNGHLLSCRFGIVLLGLAAIDVGFGKYFPILTSSNSIDPTRILFIVVYLLAMRLIYDYEKVRLHETAGDLGDSVIGTPNTLRRTIVLLALNAVVIVVAACFWERVGERCARSALVQFLTHSN